MIELKDIIYYIINSVGVIVTGLFSYLLWRATRQSAEATKKAAEIAETAELNKYIRFYPGHLDLDNKHK